MPLIDLTKEPNEEEPTRCGICDRPFQHYTKTKKVKGQAPLVELEFISCHPECTKANAKMQKIKTRIVKAKKTLHDLRTTQLNLEFEMFMKQQLKLDEDTDEIFVMLKEKEIL